MINRENKFALRWIALAFLIKGLLFLIISLLFRQNWSPEYITNFIFIHSGDTGGYYEPVENFVSSGTYTSFCRMPGLLPIYAPLYFLFGAIWGKTIVIVLQFIAGTISVYALARVAEMVFNNSRLFYYTFFIYAISTFVSNWQHYGLSDSFSVSFLIFSVYGLARYKDNNTLGWALLAGIFITWSLFFRPVHGILIPVLLLIFVLRRSDWRKRFIAMVIFSIPVVLALAAWTLRNYQQYRKPVVLQGPPSECFGMLTPQLLSIRELIIAWGGDYQPWSKGSEAQWLLSTKTDNPDNSAIGNRLYTAAYNYDSLLLLRNEYQRFTGDSLTLEEKEALAATILDRSQRYLNAYKAEKPFEYYFTNRLVLLTKLMVPARLDDFPTPAFAKMNWFHKAIKSFYFLLLLLVNSIGPLWGLRLLLKKELFPLLPLTIVFLFGFIFGYVEQRYLVPAYPFLVVLVAHLLSRLRLSVFKKR